MTTLLIHSSIRSDESVSRKLATLLADKFRDAGQSIVERDLTLENAFLSGARFAAERTPAAERSDEQQALASFADSLIAELKEADTLIIGAPVYNFGVPASLKAWADLVARAGETFTYTENGPQGLLENKKAYIVAVSGGTPIGADFDFMSPWLKFFLGFLGISDVEMITADGIMGADGEAKIAQAQTAIADLAI